MRTFSVEMSSNELKWELSVVKWELSVTKWEHLRSNPQIPILPHTNPQRNDIIYFWRVFSSLPYTNFHYDNIICKKYNFLILFLATIIDFLPINTVNRQYFYYRNPKSDFFQATFHFPVNVQKYLKPEFFSRATTFCNSTTF